MQGLEQIVGKDHIRAQEPLSRHTTFRIGGPARWYVEPETAEELVLVVRYLREQKEPYYILGNGSNVLVDDAGVDGVVVCTHSGRGGSLESVGCFTDVDGVVVCTHSGRGGSLESVGCFTEAQEMRKFFYDQGYCTPQEVENKTLVYAGSGILLSKLASEVAKKGLTGLEFASGIPGTLGGAVTMNAGAYGGEIKDVLVSARVLDQMGKVRILATEQLDLSYRHSVIQEENMIVLDALFALETGEVKKIQERMRELNERRREKQPLEYGSAGSTFKRPEGYYAGKLIQDAGLRGYRVGDVMVSEKHCGFVVNVGSGTCAQADQVIEHVQRAVYEQFGVELETEVKRWPNG